MSFLGDMAKYFPPITLKFKGSFIGIPAVGFLAIFKDAAWYLFLRESTLKLHISFAL